MYVGDLRAAVAGVDAAPAPRRDEVARLLREADLRTPAYVYDEEELDTTARRLRAVAAAAGCELAYSVKACSLRAVLERLRPHVAGFSVSSLFEARLAREVGGAGASVHLTTPGLAPGWAAEAAALSDHVSCNSLSQLERLGPLLAGRTSVGLRVNPQTGFVADPRYDPCRQHSKLGVPLDHLLATLREHPEYLAAVRGLHVHANCDSDDLSQLAATARRVADSLREWLGTLDWLNLGGGYLFGQDDAAETLSSACSPLRDHPHLRIVIEPGAAMVRSAGYLVATVVDVFDSGERLVAVLDTTVNHMPEVFEYQYEHDVHGDDEDARHEFLLAGASCLAGDVFGVYGSEEPPAVGDRVVFEDAGAYTAVKAHAFNGIALPATYTLDAGDKLRLQGSFDYHDYLRLTGGAACC